MKQVLELKLRLERRLTRELAEFFKDYLTAWAAAPTLQRHHFEARLSAILVHHYGRTIRTMQTGEWFNSTEPLSAIAGFQWAERLTGRAASQAQMIMSRVDSDIAGVKSNPLTELDFKAPWRGDSGVWSGPTGAWGGSPDGDILDRPERTKPDGGGQPPRTPITPPAAASPAAPRSPFTIGLTASLKDAWRRLKYRLPVISNINTQELAEEARWMRPSELPVGNGVEHYGLDEPLFKRWVSMEDRRVRPTHTTAHGQVVPVTHVYKVGGFDMRFPGDHAHGAPLREIINCRCMSQAGVIRNNQFIPIEGFATERGQTRATRGPNADRDRLQGHRGTSSFTFGAGKGPWRGKIILDNGDIANYTVRNGAATIRVDGTSVASAPITRDGFGKWTLGNVSVAPTHQGANIQRLLQASVEASNKL